MTQLENKPPKGWLLSGAGNTFAIEFSDEKIVTSDAAKKICEKFKVDGYLGLTQSGPDEFKWNFFNSDGSDAEFCGNAARCAQEFINRKKEIIKSSHQTTAGLVEAWSEDKKNWVKMPKPEIFSKEKLVIVENHTWKGFWCNTGVPHFVLEKPKFRHDQWVDLSKKLRAHPDFGPRGTNVTWAHAELPKKAKAVTYERGVENFTQACGTGAFAAALWMQAYAPTEKQFEVVMPGGTLRVTHKEPDWIMTGPVEKLGEWSVE